MPKTEKTAAAFARSPVAIAFGTRPELLHAQPGLTTLEYFTACALQGLLVGQAPSATAEEATLIGLQAARLAHAAIDALNVDAD